MTNWVKSVVNGVELASSAQSLNYFKYGQEHGSEKQWGAYTPCDPKEHYPDISFVSFDIHDEQERHVWVLRKEDLVKAYEILSRSTSVYISADDDNLITGMLDFHATFSGEDKL